MAIDGDILYRFAKLVTPEKETNKEKTLNGVVKIRDGKKYVQLDGSDQLTPVTTDEALKESERITVTLKDHQAVYETNQSTPAARQDDMDSANDSIAEFDSIIAYTIRADSAEFLTAKIDNLIADTAKIESLTAVTARLETLKATVASIKDLTADDIQAVRGEFASIKADLGAFTDISTEELTALHAQINNIDSYAGNFGYLSAEKLNAYKAEITEAVAQKLDAETANIKYATIDFSNIGEAAVTKLFSASGIIKDLVTENGKITGELVGVTISGDLIEGNTVKADKLVVKGSDGLFYKLNVDAMGATTEEVPDDKLHGSVIAAKTITASQISVTDLVAFDATIGGFKIGEHGIYSGAKNGATNTTPGVYMDDTGQFSLGDSTNYLRYFKDKDGVWQLQIGFGNQPISDLVDEAKEAANSANETASAARDEAQAASASAAAAQETADKAVNDALAATTELSRQNNAFENRIGTLNNTLSSIEERIKAFATAENMETRISEEIGAIRANINSILVSGASKAELNTAVDSLQQLLSTVMESTGYIKTGWIEDEYNGNVPVFGIAIGQNVQLTGETKTYNNETHYVIAKKNFLAIFTATEISFWINKVKVAYISNQRLYISNVAAITAITLGAGQGKWRMDCTNGFAIKWIGG